MAAGAPLGTSLRRYHGLTPWDFAGLRPWYSQFRIKGSDDRFFSTLGAVLNHGANKYLPECISSMIKVIFCVQIEPIAKALGFPKLCLWSPSWSLLQVPGPQAIICALRAGSTPSVYTIHTPLQHVGSTVAGDIHLVNPAPTLLPLVRKLTCKKFYQICEVPPMKLQ